MRKRRLRPRQTADTKPKKSSDCGEKGDAVRLAERFGEEALEGAGWRGFPRDGHKRKEEAVPVYVPVPAAQGGCGAGKALPCSGSAWDAQRGDRTVLHRGGSHSAAPRWDPLQLRFGGTGNRGYRRYRG